MERPKPLIPRAIYSRNGMVVVLRIPEGTPPDIARVAQEEARALAKTEGKVVNKRKKAKKKNGQTMLFDL